MPSVTALVLAASLLRVPFGSSVEVRISASEPVPAVGSVVGDFLVVSGARAAQGTTVMTLRPLGLGVLAVPLPGAQPGVVDVRPTLAPGGEPRPLLIPEPAPLPWVALAAPVVAAVLAAVVVHLLRRRARRDPVAELQRVLAPLSVPAGWERAEAADVLARSCRGFLQAVTGLPCEAMTTRELSRLLAARLEIGSAASFALALVLADDARFAGNIPPTEEAATLVRGLLEVVPAAGGQG